MKPQRILVTGGAGFIGSTTIDLLLAEGRQVLVIDNLFSGKINNLDLCNPNLEFVEGDVLEAILIDDLLKGCDAVLHLAAIVSVPYSIENPVYSFQVNTQGFLHVLQAIKHANRPIRLVYASSAAVYGDTVELPCRDDVQITNPALSPYALQKKHCEDYAALYASLYGVKSLGLRYFNVYGPRQDPSSPYSGVISRFFNAYRNGSELTVFGDGKQSRDFIHVMDVALANLRALESDYTGVLNVATGKPETLLNLIDYLGKAGGKPAIVSHADARVGDILESYAATQLAEDKLGFRATIPLSEGIKRMLAE